MLLTLEEAYPFVILYKVVENSKVYPCIITINQTEIKETI